MISKNKSNKLFVDEQFNKFILKVIFRNIIKASTLFYSVVFWQGFNANPRKAKIHMWASEITGFSSQWTSKRSVHRFKIKLLPPNTIFYYISCKITWNILETMFYFRYSANQILGKHNVYPKYVNSERSWTQAGGQNHILQYLKVSISAYDLWYIPLFWFVQMLLCGCWDWGWNGGREFYINWFCSSDEIPEEDICYQCQYLWNP